MPFHHYYRRFRPVNNIIIMILLLTSLCSKRQSFCKSLQIIAIKKATRRSSTSSTAASSLGRRCDHRCTASLQLLSNRRDYNNYSYLWRSKSLLTNNIRAAAITTSTRLNSSNSPTPSPPSNNNDNNNNGESCNIQSILQPFIQTNQITSQELNKQCIVSLSQTSAMTAQYVLEAYVKQKNRRVKNGMKSILDPSSYVLTILRNSPNQNQIELDKGGDISTLQQQQQQTSLTGNKDVGQSLSQSTSSSSSSSSTTTAAASKTSIQKTITMDQANKAFHHLQTLNQPINTLKGVGPKTTTSFHKLDIYTLRDLLWHFPRSYIDRTTLSSDISTVDNGTIGTVKLYIGKDKESIKKNTIHCTDDTGNNVDITFFYGRSKRGMMMAMNEVKRIAQFHSLVVSGKVEHKHTTTTSTRRSTTMLNPDKVVSSEKATRDVLGIEPVYALSSGLRKSTLLNAIDEAIQIAKELFESLPESLSDDALEVLSWPKLVDALILCHQPNSMDDTGPNSPARQRLAFEELCVQQAQLELMRWNLKYNIAHSVKQQQEDQQQQLPSSWNDSPLVASAVEALPFQLTTSQKDCLSEMWDDAIGDNSRMVRLLQGEVGSGKTVLAYLLALGCIDSRQGGGRVAAILAPTQLLALQHAASISKFVSEFEKNNDHSSGIKMIHVEILTGSVIGKKRDELFQRLEATNQDDAVILIGTHALVTPDIVDRLQQLPSVSSSNSKGLALAVVDEEQRFGVIQRDALSRSAANTLFMSATPIPRTFSLKGRSGLMDYTQLVADKERAVKTTIAKVEDLDRVITALKDKINSGSKCFWVLPRIGDSESSQSDSQTGSVESRYGALVEIFGEDRVGFVHGRMKIGDREEQLATFADPSSNMAILVGTTVIEVGIDVPDVNILVVEEAHRFGLAQLHQLRGRIGRAGSIDNLDCHCLLLTDIPEVTRLEILRDSNDGAMIAEADMMLRGPGESQGFLQSGIKTGRCVDPVYHWEMLPAASAMARNFSQNYAKDCESNKHVNYEEALREDRKTNEFLLELLQDGRVKPLYDDLNASSESGFALRIMMLIFGDKSFDNVKESLNILQQLAAVKQGERDDDDKLIDDKVAEIVQSSKNTILEMSSRMDDNTPPPEKTSSPKPIASSPPRMLTMKKKRVNFHEDVCFILLDVETTGLDATSSYVIQLAGKELGASLDNEFAEYILPPVEVPKIIEEITGITDDFLRSGNHREFKEVYLEFQKFCNRQANGRHVCFVAHNARFDIGMMESELKRWRTADNSGHSAPVLADVFASSVDTLTLFKDRRLWATSRPSSFKLGDVYHHVFNENITNAHNAVGDVRALERLLLSNQLSDWKSIANTIQKPFIKIVRD